LREEALRTFRAWLMYLTPLRHTPCHDFFSASLLCSRSSSPCVSPNRCLPTGIVATSLVFFPAAPLFLLMHGKDTTIPKGAEVTAYVNGDLKLNPAKFTPAAESHGTTSTDAPTSNPPTGMPSQSTPQVGSIEFHSNPDSAEVYADGSFIGNAPATLKLSPSQHTNSSEVRGVQRMDS
jgi:hypothetical protein